MCVCDGGGLIRDVTEPPEAGKVKPLFSAALCSTVSLTADIRRRVVPADKTVLSVRRFVNWI